MENQLSLNAPVIKLQQLESVLLNRWMFSITKNRGLGEVQTPFFFIVATRQVL